MAIPTSHYALHPLKSALLRTGLSADVLRSWEKRYRAVSPQRSAGGQRLYSDDDIERLVLLQRLLRLGRRIGQLAPLRTEQLRALLLERPEEEAGDRTEAAASAVAGALALVEACDASRLGRALHRAVITLGVDRFLDGVVAPMAQALDDRARDASVTPAQLQLAGASVGAVLSAVRDLLGLETGAPRTVVATTDPCPDQSGLHLIATTATLEGWEPIPLGAHLDPAAIRDAAVRAEARAAVIWVGSRAPRDSTTLDRLREDLPDAIAMVGFGPGAAAEAPGSGVTVLRGRASLCAFLASFH